MFFFWFNSKKIDNKYLWLTKIKADACLSKYKQANCPSINLPVEILEQIQFETVVF